MRELRIIVVGAGMAGILAGIRLKQSGYRDFSILEKADTLAGTWRDNRYPGLTCDIPSHSYTYSFEPNPDWSRTYPPGAEIFDYFAGVADRYGVAEHIRFGKEVAKSVFEDGGWTITTKDGAVERADVLILATGVLHHPRYPDIAGLDTFAGDMFHSARWDASVELDGRRVGVVGSGSTGVQIVAALAGRASQLTHFQRTPQWILKSTNNAFTDEQRAAFRADRALIAALHDAPEYQQGLAFFTRAVTNAESPEMAAVEANCLANLDTNVKEPALREKLRPDYRAACKRLINSPDYYEKVQLPGVEVVTNRIACVEPDGVRTADGTLHPLDVLVLATGFKADAFMRPMHVTGRDGADLDRLWERRPSAFLAVSVPDFPNMFMLNGPSAPFGNFSAIATAEAQMELVLKLVAKLRDGEARELSVRPETMAAYNAELKEAVKSTIWTSGCDSWYLDKDGVPTIWPYSFDEFTRRTENPDTRDFDLVA